MTARKIYLVSLSALGLGTLTTVAALVRGGGLSVLLDAFGLLALSPYAVFGAACFLARTSRGRAIAALSVTALATVFALLLYGDLIFINPGSMSGLVFLLVPSYQLPAAIVLLVAVFFTRPRNREPSA